MKWKYTVIHHPARIALGLNNNEYSILDIIYKSQTHPKYTVEGWANTGCHKIAAFLCLSPATVLNAFNKAEKMGLLEFDESRSLKKTTAAWYEIAYQEGDEIQGLRCSETELHRSEIEQGGVQKLNANRSEIEPKGKEDKITHTTRTRKENSNTLKAQKLPPLSSAASPPSDEGKPDYIRAAEAMADYFTNDPMGQTEWRWMCETKKVKAKPIDITSQWAAKQCDSPYILKNWRKHTGKIINWIKQPVTQPKSNYQGQPNNQPSYTAPENVKSGQVNPGFKKVSPDEAAELLRNSKFWQND